MLLNTLVFADAIRLIFIVNDDLNRGKGDDNLAIDLQQKVKLFHSERNAYITGFNVFLTMISYRLFDTMREIYEVKEGNSDLYKKEIDRLEAEPELEPKKVL